MNALVEIAVPPSQMILQRRCQLLHVRLACSCAGCCYFRGVAPFGLQRCLPTSHGEIDVLFRPLKSFYPYDVTWIFARAIEVQRVELGLCLLSLLNRQLSLLCYRLNVLCHRLNVLCHSLNVLCHRLNVQCHRLNVLCHRHRSWLHRCIDDLL